MDGKLRRALEGYLLDVDGAAPMGPAGTDARGAGTARRRDADAALFRQLDAREAERRWETVVPFVGIVVLCCVGTVFALATGSMVAISVATAAATSGLFGLLRLSQQSEQRRFFLALLRLAPERQELVRLLLRAEAKGQGSVALVAPPPAPSDPGHARSSS